MIRTIRFLALALSVGLLACDRDALETAPNDRISSDIFWKTDRDALLGANAVYPSLDGTNTFAWDGITDIGNTNQVFNRDADIERGIHDALHPRPQTEWTTAYQGIRRANEFMANVDRVETTNQTLITRLQGEVRTLRAYHYIKLLGLFGDVPLVTEPISIEESRALTRTPAAQVWDFISTELTEAATQLPNTQAEKGRVTKGTALALKARAMLWAGRYAPAAEAAKQVMDLGVHSLYPRFGNLFTYAAENNAEVLLDKQFVKDNYSNNVFAMMAPYSQRTSSSTYIPTKNLVDAYPMQNGRAITDPASGFDPLKPYQNRDPRLRFTAFVPGDTLPDGKIYDPRPTSGTADAIGGTFIATQTGFNLKKYISRDDLANPGNGGLNIILLRYAEVLLTYAEAKIELNQIDASVVAAVNAVRQRSDVRLPALPATLTQAQWREAVRLERTLELAFEGLRLFDLRRWKLAEKTMVGAVKGMMYLNPAGQLATIERGGFVRQFDPAKHYLWPIPQKERDLNPNLTQNPNW